MELGGNAPFIVFPGSDLEKAASDLCALKYGNCGQICVSPNRVFVHEEIYDAFMGRFLKKADSVKVGFGRTSGAEMGPLISESARRYVEDLVEDARKKGGKITLGGSRPGDLKRGYFYQPTVIENVKPDMDVFRKEIFGPVAAVLSFRSEEEVLKMANDTEYGLSSYVYTSDVQRIQYFSEGLEFGEVHVNGFKYDIYLPHGGIKESGIGHDCSHLALEDYLVKKRITVAN
jgi:succinate-semialdehyde dehydrogenase/glutarate-semialdehyde dehydrogenase